MSRSSEQELSHQESNEKHQTHVDGAEDDTSVPSHQQLIQSPENQQRENNNINDDDNKPKRNPFCSRCRNHGKSAQVKGHKRHCEYRDCKCEGCQLVEVRQLVSAAQIKRRREQKQDEECGRKIEISPPVLARELDQDPAALIAKTLIGTSAKHVHLNRTPPKQQLGSVIQQPHLQQHQYKNNHNGLTSPSILLPETSGSHLSPVSTHNLVNSLDLHSHHHNLHHHHHSHQLAVNTTHHKPSTSQHLQHHHGHQLPVQLKHTELSPPTSLTTNDTTTTATTFANVGPPHQSSISNALQLFHFPNSVISAAAAAASLSAHPHQGNHQTNMPISGATQAFNNHHNLSQQQSSLQTHHQVPLPSIREQINLVEEIHHSYGPMAIYAWLKAEKFDHQKVRDIIEISRASYNNLIDLKSKYRLENRFANHQFTAGIGEGLTSAASGNNLPNYTTKHSVTNGTSGISSSNICSGVSSSNSNSNSNCSSDNSNGSSSRSGSENNANRCANGNIANGDVNDITNNKSSNQETIQSHKSSDRGTVADYIDTESSNNNNNRKSSTTTATTKTSSITTNHGFTPDSMPPSPLYTFSGSTNHSNIKNNNNCSDINNSVDRNSLALTTTASHQKTTATAASHLPFTNTLNSLPMATAQSLLWPGFKMSTNVTGTPVLHPHFLPHFMQHPFNTAAAAAAAAAAAYHNQSAYTNNHLQQVSPIDSSVTNSSPSAPSSSAVL